MKQAALIIAIALPVGSVLANGIDPYETYNQAVRAYQQGNAEEARSGFDHAALRADASLETNARYNLGNCDYSEALSVMDQSPDQAITSLNRAINQYRAALAIDPLSNDIRANLESAAALIDQIQKEQKEQQGQDQQNQQDHEDQQQDTQQQNQEQQNQQKQNEEPQNQDQQKQNQPSQDQQQEPQQTPQDGKPEQSEQKQEQENQQPDQKDQQPDDAQPQPATGDEQEPQKHPEESQSPQTPPSEDESVDAQDKQPVPDEQKLPTESDDTTQMPDTSEAGEMNPDEAGKLLQSIRDRDLERRIEQFRREAARYQPVDRDW